MESITRNPALDHISKGMGLDAALLREDLRMAKGMLRERRNQDGDAEVRISFGMEGEVGRIRKRAAYRQTATLCSQVSHPP